MKRALAALGIMSLALIVSCETFDSPPRVSIAGAVNGMLSDSAAPLRIEFSESIVTDSLRLRVVPYTPDEEGNLRELDAADDSAAPPLRVLYQYDVDEGIRGGKEEFSDENSTLVIRPNAPLPVGTRLALVIESGLRDLNGNRTNVRNVILFSYEFKCADSKPSTLLTTGPYFFLLQIEKPLSAQVQLFSWLDVDPKTGQFSGQFTSADRNLNLSCPTPCDAATQVCKLKPEPACVAPSEKAISPDEYTDFGTNAATESNGFTFPVSGCAQDQADGTAVMATVPSTVDLVAGGVKVTVNGLIVTSAFTKGDDGVLRASGSGTGGEVVLGGARDPGGAAGTLTARNLPEPPANLPRPTANP
jgi:hypothetical protein